MKSLLKLLIVCFFINSHFSFSQTKITIYNTDNEPLSYVNVSMRNDKLGLHSNEFGEIAFDHHLINTEFVFSKAGYRDTTVLVASNLASIVMKKAPIHKEEYPTIDGKRVIKIGAIHGENYGLHSNSGKPIVFLQYFSADQSYGYQFDKLSFKTKNELPLAKMHLRFYAADENFEPGDYLYGNDVIIEVKSEERLNVIDLSEFNMRMPKHGVFIGLETLIIPENLIRYDQYVLMTDETIEKVEYMPKYVLQKNQDENIETHQSLITSGIFYKTKGYNLNLAIQLKLKRP